FYLTGTGTGHIQSVILAGALMSMGFQCLLVAFLADVIAANRKLLEDIRYTQRATQGENGNYAAARSSRKAG
ncbi:MAG: glycosyltransferase family 2 protein, partial [Mesorhizobium sp.]